jgi:hypothetical protein
MIRKLLGTLYVRVIRPARAQLTRVADASATLTH